MRAMHPARALTANEPKTPLRVKGKLHTAIELMVFEGLEMDDAAAKVGLTTFSVRRALDRPHVIAHLRARREVSRAAACAANIHRLKQIRDAADNMPAVQAIRSLEQLGEDEAGRPSAMRMPGLQIVLIQPASGGAVNVSSTAIEAKPLISHDRVRDDE